MEDATISNLKLATVSITGNGNVGALVGQATGTTALSNIELIGDESQSSSNAEIKGSGANVGGLVGQFSGTISDVSSSLTVRGGTNNDVFVDSVGGLVGRLQSGSIKNSNNSGSVSAPSASASIGGGLVGQNQGNISNSWASGNVFFGDGEVGGLVGQNQGNISNSWASGNVSGSIRIGGLVGDNDRAISNSWASGNVRGVRAGGLVGGGAFHASIISNSWASGNVSGSTVGGLLGRCFNNCRITGRNYQLDGAVGGATLGGANPNSFHLASTADLASLSGAATTSTNYGTHSGWHAGFGSDPYLLCFVTPMVIVQLIQAKK